MDTLETKCPKKLGKFETASLRTLSKEKLFTNKVIVKQMLKPETSLSIFSS